MTPSRRDVWSKDGKHIAIYFHVSENQDPETYRNIQSILMSGDQPIEQLAAFCDKLVYARARGEALGYVMNEANDEHRPALKPQALKGFENYVLTEEFGIRENASHWVSLARALSMPSTMSGFLHEDEELNVLCYAVWEIPIRSTDIPHKSAVRPQVNGSLASTDITQEPSEEVRTLSKSCTENESELAHLMVGWNLTLESSMDKSDRESRSTKFDRRARDLVLEKETIISQLRALSTTTAPA